MKHYAISPAIRRMVREDTGSHFLDSGGIYGYQYNRGIPKQAIYPSKGSDGEVEWHVISLAHFLDSNLTYDPKITRSLTRFGKSPARERESWEDTMEAWIKRHGITCEQGYNSYNEENDLDQDFAWWTLTLPTEDRWGDPEIRVLVRSHNGCDARGGYSAPRIFTVSEGEGESWYPRFRLSYYCHRGEVIETTGRYCGDFMPAEGTLTEDGAVCPNCGLSDTGLYY